MAYKVNVSFEAPFSLTVLNINQSEVNIMTDKNNARTQGYERGVTNQGSSSTWGQAFGDQLVNESGSSQARSEGYQQGRRDAAYIKAQNSSSGGSSGSSSSGSHYED